MARLAARSDGRYQAKYHGKYFYGSTPAEAKRKRDEYKARELMGAREPARVTVAAYAARWLPVAKAGVEPKVYNDYAGLLDRLVTALGSIRLAEVTPTDVKAVYNTLLGLSDSTVKKLRMLTVAMFDAAVEDGLIRSNPARSRSAKPHRGTVGTHRILTPEELRLVRTVDHRCRPFALAMYYAGLRRGEALALNVSRDVDFRENMIHIREAVRFDSNQPILTDPKTEAGVRDIPLLPPLRAVLRPIRGLLLSMPDGTHCTEQAFSRAWEAYNNALSRAANGGVQRRWWGRTREQKAQLVLREQLLAAGRKAEADALALPPYKEISLRCHDFRHSYCTNLCDAGVDLHVAIQWLGHADEKMILQVYDHVTPARIRTAIANATAYFGRQNGRQIYRITRKPSKIGPPKPRHYTLRL